MAKSAPSADAFETETDVMRAQLARSCAARIPSMKSLLLGEARRRRRFNKLAYNAGFAALLLATVALTFFAFKKGSKSAF